MNSNNQKFIDMQESYEKLKDANEMPLNDFLEKYHGLVCHDPNNEFNSIVKTDE